jgi:hypothetical protein
MNMFAKQLYSWLFRKIIVTLAASYPRQSSYVFRLFSLNGHLSPARQAWA